MRKSNNVFKRWIIRFFDWVVSNDEKSPYADNISFSSAGMVVHGFMRDYRLLSKIDPLHFVDAKGSYVENSSMLNQPIVSSPDVEESASASNVAVLMVPNRMPIHLNLGYETTQSAEKKVKIKVDVDGPNPKDILCELGTVPVPADFKDLDKKLETYLRIYDLIRIDASRGNKETIQDVIQRLQNRKKYKDSQDLQAFFEQFKCTTDEAINLLLDKHQHLKIGPADDFIPEMPADAHERMLSYSDKVVGMCNSKPVFYLIAKATDFRRALDDRGKRDPILLVQSPIGFYWQIIGAWDADDMLLVNEL